MAEKHPVDQILDSAAAEVRTLDLEAKTAVLRAIVRGYAAGRSAQEILAAVRRVLDRFAPVVAEAVGDARLGAWIAGAASVARRVPRTALDVLAGPPDPLPRPLVAQVRRVRRSYPVVGDAAEWLGRRRVVTASQAAAIGDSLTWDAFAVADVENAATLRRVRDLLAAETAGRVDLKSFKKKAARALRGEDVTATQVEATFRTGVRRAFADAQSKLSKNPVVSEIFPFREYLPITDGRTRDDHLALGFFGLDETGVYWADDPMWDYFTPPWDYNCRCDSVLLTVEAAARRGVSVAREWLVSGERPESKEWMIDVIPFRPRHNLRTVA